jgi:prostamide/prostaglandin F2alpha synthase
MELDALSPLLKAHDVRLVGIGFEEVGVGEFMDGEYFSGEIYIDFRRKSYKALSYRTFNIFTLMCTIFSSKVGRDALAKVRGVTCMVA